MGKLTWYLQQTRRVFKTRIQYTHSDTNTHKQPIRYSD